MRQILRLAAGVVLGAALLAPGPAGAQEEITVRIAKHAQLTGGTAVIRAEITCNPLPGVEDFSEAFAGVHQPSTGAESEGGLDGMVVCDGVTRTHTAHLTPFTDAQFKHGPAIASISVFFCLLVGDQQLCFNGFDGRRVVLRGG